MNFYNFLFLDMRFIKLFTLSILLSPFLVQAQSDFEKMKAEEEAYRKKQQQAEKNYADDYQAKLDSLHLEYVKYEIEREKEVLEFEGKNLDPRLVEKAQALEAKNPRNITFYGKDEERSVLGRLMEVEEELIKKSTNYMLDKPKEPKEKGEVISTPEEGETTLVEEQEEENTESENISTINLADLPNLTIEEKEILELEFEANWPIYIPIK